jgi:hypothetical protein
MLREFEHGEDLTTPNDGMLHYLTIRQPREAEDNIARAKAAPIIDCSLEGLQKMRPQQDRVELPPLPARLCSEAEREALRQRLRAAAAAAQANIERMRAYFNLVSEHGRVLDAAADTREHRLHLANLRAERNWALDQNLANSRISYWAEQREKLLAAMPIVPCDGPPDATAVPGTVPGDRMGRSPVPPRPVLPASGGPVAARRLCTEADRSARLAQLDAAIRAAQARLGPAMAHLGVLIQLQLALKTGNANEFDQMDVGSEVRSYGALVDALKLALEDLAARRAETASRALDPCATAPEPRPALVAPTPRFAVPQRPELPAAPVAPVPGRICTEADRTALLAQHDAAIAAADERLAAASKHLTSLNELSGRLSIEKADFNTIQAVSEETRAYQAVVNELYTETERQRAARNAALSRPLDPCDPPAQPETPKDRAVVPGGNPVPVTPGGKKKACPPDGKKPGRAPIKIGSNGKVGSGARAAKKLVSTLGGLAGGLLGGGGGGGGGGGKGGPPLADCKIKDSEKTVFTDPETGISLRVAAKRAGDTLVVFADVAKSPDKGTFQSGWIETPEGDLQAPRRADICAMWGEWSLTVSWTRETYVDGNLVSRETGGYREGGRFSLPGLISTDDKPAGLWKQFGFSNAQAGAREVALSYALPRRQAGSPMNLLVHVTRPSRNPVDTKPFNLVMREGAQGFSFALAPPDDDICVPEEGPREPGTDPS